MTSEIAWLATYLVHSTALLGAAALLASRRAGLPAAWRETLWRAALVGGVVTASAQTAFAPSPWSIDVPEPAPAVTHAQTPATVAPGPAAPIATKTPPAAATPTAPVAADPRPTPAATPDASILPDALALVAIGFALLAVVRWLGAIRSLRRRLSARRPLEDGAWRDALEALARRAGRRGRIRLSVVPGLGSPLARGILRPEICVPERALEELGDAERDALLAHELAHVVRRDALRMAVGRAVETGFAIQPLNRLAGARLREVAELRCDRMAAGWTGAPRTLAGCLTRVATWVLESRTGAWLPAMASRGRLLRDRVRGLTEPRVDSRRRRLSGVAALVLLVALGVVIPPFSTAAAATHPGPFESAAPATGGTLAEELDGLENDMKQLEEALAEIEGHPGIRSRIGRLGARWESLRRRAESVRTLTKEEER